MAIIPFFSSCSKIYNGLKNILKEVAHAMEEDMKKPPFEPLEGYKIVKIERRNLNDWHNYKFPYILMENKEVERKVNALLQMENFGVVFNGPDGSCVDGIDHIVRLSYAGKPTTKFYDDSFSRNLSIKIAFTESDGTETLFYYNFNPKTGDLYHLEDFFNIENYCQFQSKLLGYEVTYEDLADLSNFEFTQDKIGVRISLSSRFDLTQYSVIKISDIEPLLNDYGRAALITGEGLEKYHTDLPPLLYEGTIGEEPVYYLREHPFIGGRDQLFFRNTGKYGERAEEVNLLEFPDERRIRLNEIERKDIEFCDAFWYDGPFWIEHIDKEKEDPDGLKPGDRDYYPFYVYKDMGKDLFCYHVTEDGLEGYYQTPCPSDHEMKVTGFNTNEDAEEDYRYRIEEYGVKPQKYQVKLKKM